MIHREPSLRMEDRAFTLVELLVVIAVIGVLSSLLLPAIGKGKRHARQIEEISSAKQLVMAAAMYADENEEKIFPGYVSDPNLRNHRGEPIGFPVNARYPWRLHTYLGSSFDIMYAAENRGKLEELRTLSAEDYVYAASVYPSLGVNSYFIGGNETEFPADAANRKFGGHTVPVKVGEVRRPSDLMMFMSARSAAGGLEANGYFQVTPPYLTSRRWDSDWALSKPPGKTGFVALRHGSRAVAAMVDGHVETLGWTEVQDMRRWSNTAIREDETLGEAR